MTTEQPCAYAGRAQAVRDGRLCGEDAADVAAHVEGCARCAREQQELIGLGDALRSESAMGVDPARLRALRERILTAAVGDQTGRPWVPPTALVMAAVALVIGYTGALFIHRAAPVKPHDVLRVQAGAGGAHWTRRHGDQIEEVILRRGTLHLDVRRTADDPRVRVVVPDGYIDDVGTSFSVTVSEERTTRIAVELGRVDFSRPGVPPMALSAGMTWTAGETRLPGASANVASSVGTAGPTASDGGVAASGHGQSRPHHAHAEMNDHAREDAAYLRLMTLIHEHRDAEARVAAARYLKAFPDGFRRKEVAAVLASP